MAFDSAWRIGGGGIILCILYLYSMKRFSKVHLLSLLVALPILVQSGLFAQNFTDIQANFGNWGNLNFVKFDLGDFDQDGDLDVISYDGVINPPSLRLLILRNDGGGMFTQVPYALTAEPSDIGWVDLDNDGDLDVYLVANAIFPYQPELFFYRNDSSMGFSFMNSGLPIAAGGDLEWADMDNDGDPDLIHATSPGGSNPVTQIYRNQGNMFFQLATHNLPHLHLQSAAVGDYDNDGDIDVIGRGNTSPFTIYRNDGALSFTSIATTISGSSFESKLGDYDADGDLDLATSSGLVYRNDAGNFVHVATFAASNSIGFLDWVDYDGDGDLDIVNGGDLYIPMNYLPPVLYVNRNDGNNVFTPINFGNNGVAQGDVRWGDFNNDGKPDILASGYFSNTSRKIILYQNTGPAPTNSPPTAPTGLQADIAPDSSIVFSWNRSSDAITSSAGLSYRLWISGSPGLPDYATPLSDTITGLRHIASRGNLQDTSWVLRNYPLGQTFYARVQAIDGGLMGSPWSAPVVVSDTLLAGAIETSTYATACFLHAPGATYADSVRWYQCNPWQMVPGADQATFQPGNNNAYAAVLYVGNQSDTTACLTTQGTLAIDTTVLVQSCFAEAAGAAQADSVQWIDCNSLQAVPGETNATYSPGTAGDYAVVFYHCSGTDTSSCHSLTPSITSPSINSSTCGLAIASLPQYADSVQWINCNTQQSIPGADDSTFVPTVAGDFAVVVYGCFTTDTSVCVSYTPFVLNTAITVSGSVLSLPGGQQADSVKWLSCNDPAYAGPLPDNTLDSFPAIVSGEYRAILYHCNGTDTTVCQYVDAQFVPLSIAAAPMPGASQGSVDWADFDNDGDLDLLITGTDTFGGGRTDLYQYNNVNGTFSAVNTGLPTLELSDAAWGDCDNDGDLDLLLTGWRDSVGLAMSRIYRNDGLGVFTDVVAGLDSMPQSSCSWADYDNDGDLDAFVSGNNPPQCKLYRNDGSNQFSLQSSSFDGVFEASADWGDYDNDGDLDLVYSGVAITPANPITRLYRNDGNGTFVSVNHNFPAVFSGSTLWGDYDADGYLDLVVCGFDVNQQVHADLFHNNAGASFSPVAAGFRPMGDGEADWGDFDNDGNLDLVITGGFSWGNLPAVRLYRNLGNSTFDEITTWPNRPSNSASQWGDFDADGDLDLVVTGVTYGGWETIIYRNDSVVVSNLIPQAPPVVNATVSGPGSIAFSWNPGSDATTPVPGLSYQLMVGTTPGGTEVVSPMLDTANGWRLLPDRGPIQNLSWTLEDAQPGLTYYARVFAIDAGRSGSQPSAIGTILLNSESGGPGLLQAGPIPTRDWLRVKVPMLTVEAQLDLVDVQGKSLLSEIVAANHSDVVKLDLSGLATGTYFLQWKPNGGLDALTMRVVRE